MLFKRKNKQIQPVDTFCRNCEVRAIGRYCHKCGQDTLADRELPIFFLVTHLFNKAFALDGRLPATLKNLIWRPGRLSKEYRAGKIVKYVHPVKLFWFSTIVFFALMISQINSETNMDETGKKSLSINVNKEKPALAQEIVLEEPKNLEKTNPETSEKNQSSGDQIIDYFSKYGSFVAFLLIPIFALLLALFFWRNKFFYMYHLVFALHFHTFLWVYFSLLIMVRIIFPNVDFSDWIGLLIFLIPGVYLSIAMHRFYQTTRWNTIWKTVFIGFVYFILVLTVTVLLLLLALWILEIL
jgi:hypothetical protein